MRIWSIHPKYLDSKRLTAVWRETILAKAVLECKTKGYRFHPQLERFKEQENPIIFLNTYLYHIYLESCRRGYCFNESKIRGEKTKNKIKVTDRQLLYEFNHLKKKLKNNGNLSKIKFPEQNPLFVITKGPIEKWEKIKISK